MILCEGTVSVVRKEQDCRNLADCFRAISIIFPWPHQGEIKPRDIVMSWYLHFAELLINFSEAGSGSAFCEIRQDVSIVSMG